MSGVVTLVVDSQPLSVFVIWEILGVETEDGRQS